MTPDNWIDLFRTLGVAAPLVGLLAWLLREATRERQVITEKFLAALETAIAASNESRIRTATEMSQLTHAMEEHQRRSAEEHERIVRSLDTLHERWNGRERRGT